MSTPLTVTLLVVFWVRWGRSGVPESPGPRCDDGKLYLERDLPVGDDHWDCPVSSQDTSQRHPTVIDTSYDPEPARHFCMDSSISYNYTIPNSGAYRPVRAESGEYLYCPPQRWLNNLHHEAVVLLHHPCAPLHERLLLSVLARSCLPHYIITAHKQLSKHTPIALVSWGRTLELSTMATSHVCDWLEKTTSRRNKFVDVSRKYNLLLTSSAETHRRGLEEEPAKLKESLRQCCERTISSHNGTIEEGVESQKKRESLKILRDKGTHRHVRASIRGKQKNNKENTTHEFRSNRTSRPPLKRTEDAHNNNDGTLDSSAMSRWENRTPSYALGLNKAPSHLKIQNINQILTHRPSLVLESNVAETALKTDSEKTRLPKAVQQNSHKNISLRRPKPLARFDLQRPTAWTESLVIKSKEGTDSVKHVKHVMTGSKEKHSADSLIKVHEVFKERESEQQQTHRHTHSHNKDEKTGFASKGLPRTPRTEEALWAAAALGFLLVLLTLSVLHTRLYRHWRTSPSLYWHDPKQDYDSVADVIHRRIRLAKRRQRRGRRQECVLLPSSSSSEELL
ncbi:uncharacterized protein tp53i13 isoform X1 [Labrus bergylta]|uniref:Tumor protein p53 inducible protein 13 n=1 Tax=Labrus bergylta TaxID=56723 RepID=A0A3Q3FYM8_9LABR|nr:tumor protein p53-inducible protein 13 isoform X1 [Labrus bergylta]XP_029135294.1 tumor protein p53-inducible protein 13 isoform X1 [Labrus bergylta]